MFFAKLKADCGISTDIKLVIDISGNDVGLSDSTLTSDSDRNTHQDDLDVPLFVIIDIGLLVHTGSECLPFLNCLYKSGLKAKIDLLIMCLSKIKITLSCWLFHCSSINLSHQFPHSSNNQ